MLAQMSFGPSVPPYEEAAAWDGSLAASRPDGLPYSCLSLKSRLSALLVPGKGYLGQGCQ